MQVNKAPYIYSGALLIYFFLADKNNIRKDALLFLLPVLCYN
jgi:hypothetical protein